ncbi:MAG: FAD-dependent oxidoreductase [Desulfobacterales bacterium]|nr:FAD-dependent oxidoreductase [Desulfobacterales bacterium]
MQIAVAVIGGLGLIVGIVLAAASRIFYVYVDPKVEAVEGELPGANCGGCGLPGCSANAEAIVLGKAAPNSCVAAGPEVAEAIAAIMGMSLEAKEPDIALPGCTYGTQDADIKFVYDGLNDCRAAALMGGGMKVCNIGCLGLGTCVTACQFGALKMGDKGLPVVDEALCTGCGACERICPKNIINLSSVTRRILKEYTTEDCTTPCQRACPAGIDICEYINQISKGNYSRSVQVIKERNPFPTIIGRICPRPCETECRRQYVDEPVAINYLKRFVADYEMEKGDRVLPFKAPETGRKIAVIGGGVQGLSAAFFSARLGHSPTVYEATSKMGGLLRSAIATERLPHKILDWDIDGIARMGVELMTNTVMGKDITVNTLLKEEYQAVFLASGGWDSRLTRKSGKEPDISPIPGAYLLIDFTRMSSASYGEHVVIMGSGSPVVDTAKRCKTAGSKSVTIVSRDCIGEHGMTPEEIGAVQAEGINMIFNAAVSRILGEEDKMTGIEYADLTKNEITAVSADTLIISAGRFPEVILRKVDPESEMDEIFDDKTGPLYWEGVLPYKNPAQYGKTGLFAEGETLTDFSAAIKAIGAGRRAAASVHQIMYGIKPELSEKVLKRGNEVQNIFSVSGVQIKPRLVMPVSTAKEQTSGAELEKGFTEEMARMEASRCLKCGLICYEHADKKACA